jgi:hypothetical protein
MIRLTGKALIYRDFKTSFWFVPILFVELLLVYSWEFIIDKGAGLEISSFDYSRTIAALIIVSFTMLLMSAVLFHYEKRFTYHTLCASMPFSKSEIIISKWLVGVYNIAISFSAFYVVLNCLLIRNYMWKRLIIDTTKLYITAMLVAIFIFGLMLLLQSANGSTWLGSFITFLCAAVPVTVLSVIYGVYRKYLFGDLLTPGFLDGHLFKNICYKLYKGIFFMMGMDFDIFYPLGYSYKPNAPGIGETFVRCLVYIALIVFVFLISLFIFKKSRYEKMGHIASVGGMEKFYRAVISYSSSFLVFVLVSIIGGDMRLDLAVLFCVIIPILLYLVLGRVIRRYNSRMS